MASSVDIAVVDKTVVEGMIVAGRVGMVDKVAVVVHTLAGDTLPVVGGVRMVETDIVVAVDIAVVDT